MQLLYVPCTNQLLHTGTHQQKLESAADLVPSMLWNKLLYSSVTDIISSSVKTHCKQYQSSNVITKEPLQSKMPGTQTKQNREVQIPSNKYFQEQ